MGHSGEYRRGAWTGHWLFMASLNDGAPVAGLEAMRDRAMEAFAARPPSGPGQAFSRGFGDIVGIYLADLRELQEPPVHVLPRSVTCSPAPLPARSPEAQASVRWQEMEAGA